MKKISIVLFALLTTLIANAQWDGYATPIVNGTGTWNDPYLIECPGHLAYVSQQVYTGATDYAGQYLELTCDISLSNINWEPIGIEYNDRFFRGNFNGAGNTIDSVYMSANAPDDALNNYGRKIFGLFGCVEDGLLENITINVSLNALSNSNYQGYAGIRMGGIAAYVNNSIVRNCVVNGVINNELASYYHSQVHINYTLYGANGGAIGSAKNSFIQFVNNRCVINSAATSVGGIVGWVDSCEVFGCTNEGKIIGHKPVAMNNGYYTQQNLRFGGIVGYSKSHSYIGQCANLADVSAVDFILSAKLAGISFLNGNTNIIEYCYNTGSIYTNYTSSNLNNNDVSLWGIGPVHSDSIMSCYNVGSVTSTSYTNRYAIKAKPTTEPTYITGNCYYRNDCLGINSHDTNQFGIPRDSLNMKTAAFVAMLNNGSNVFVEDINNVNNGYPILAIHQPVVEYTVTAIPDDENKGTVTGGGTYTAGTSVTLTATANSGYHFTQWQDGNTQNPRTITVNGNATYIAWFSQDGAETYTITVLSEDETKGTVTGGGVYSLGEDVVIRAYPNAGYTFKKWNDDNTDNPRVITVEGNRTYMAYFNGNNEIDEKDKDIYCKLYPNPAVEIATIVMGAANEAVRVSLMDILGHRILAEELDCTNGCAKSIDVRSLTKGIYFVRIETPSNSTVYKLIVE